MRRKIVAISIMAILTLVSLMPFIPTVSATNDPPNGPGFVNWSGHWTVTDTRTYDSMTVINMQDGNVTVADGGKLTLDMAGIEFNAPSDGELGITVQDGGTFIMKNIAYTDTNNANSYFMRFEEGSTIDLDDSNIRNAVGNRLPWGSWAGMSILTENFTADNVRIYAHTDPSYIVYVQDGGVATFRNSTIETINGGPIVHGGVLNLHDSTILNVGVWGGWAIALEDGGEVYLINNDIGNAYGSVGMFDDGYLYAKGNKFHNNSQYGLCVARNVEADFIGNDIAHNPVGISVDTNSTVNLWGKNNIHHNGNGISAYWKATVNSTGSKIHDNAEANVHIEEQSNAIIRKGRMAGGDYGVQADFFSDVTLDRASFGPFNRAAVEISHMSYLYSEGSLFDVSPWMTSVQIRSMSEADLIGNTFKTSYTGISGSMESTVTSEDNIFEEVGTAIELWGDSVGYSHNDTGTQDTWTWGNGLYSGGSSELYVTDFEWTSGLVDANAGGTDEDGYLEIVDSTINMPNADTLYYTWGGHIRSINSNPTSDKAFVYDAPWPGMIEFGHHVDVVTEWQNNASAPMAHVTFVDSQNDTKEDFMTDENGTYSLDVISETVTFDGITDHNDYTIIGELGGMTGEITQNITDNHVDAQALVIQIMDDGIPELNITYPMMDWITNTPIFVMNGTSADEGSGIPVVQVSDDGTIWYDADGLMDWEYEWNLTEGEYVLEAKVVDIAGNEVTDFINVTIDLTMPDLTVSEPDMYVTSNEFNISGETEIGATLTIDGLNVTVEADGTFETVLNLTDGQHTIVLVSTDVAGNARTVNKDVIVDTVAPTVASDMADGSYVNMAAVTLTGTTDADLLEVNGLNATIDTVNGTWSIDLTLEEGANNVSIEAKDLAGHTTTIDQIINVDTIPPELEVTAPAVNGTIYTNNATFPIAGTVTGADTLMLGDNVLTISNGTFTTTVTLTDGENLLTLAAKDLAGNEATVTLTVILDTKAPELEITSPEDGLVTNSATVTVTGTVDDLDATLKHGATNLTNVNGTFSLTASLSVGQNTLEVTAMDLAGNTATISIDVTYDNTVALLVESPKKEKVTTTKDTVSITGTSESGAVVTVNGVTVSDAGGNFDYEMVLKEGKNTVTVTVMDQAGNTETQVFTVTKEDTSTGTMDLATTLGIGVILLIIGLIVGLLIGRMAGKPKEQPSDRYYPKAEDDEEEEPTTGPEPEEESPFKAEDEETPDKEPEDEPKDGPEDEPEEEPKDKKEPPKDEDDKGSLEDLLADLDKKK